MSKMKRYDVNDVFWKYMNLGDVEKRVGKNVFAGDNYDYLIDQANNGANPNGVLEGTGCTPTGRKGLRVTDLNGNSNIFTYIIVEKEPERIPLDFKDPEVRKFLLGRAIRRKDGSYEKIITYFSSTTTRSAGVTWKCTNLSAADLFREWEYIEPVNGSNIIGELKE